MFNHRAYACVAGDTPSPEAGADEADSIGIAAFRALLQPAPEQSGLAVLEIFSFSIRLREMFKGSLQVRRFRMPQGSAAMAITSCLALLFDAITYWQAVDSTTHGPPSRVTCSLLCPTYSPWTDTYALLWPCLGWALDCPCCFDCLLSCPKLCCHLKCLLTGCSCIFDFQDWIFSADGAPPRPAPAGISRPAGPPSRGGGRHVCLLGPKGKHI